MTVRLSLNTHSTDCRREDPFARALYADSPPIKTDHSIKSFGQGDRVLNTRSKRQLESWRQGRDWHLSMALRARLEGRIGEAEFHIRYYSLLGPAVTSDEAQEQSREIGPP